MFNLNDEVLLLDVINALKESTLFDCVNNKEEIKKFLVETKVFQVNSDKHSYLVGPLQNDDSVSFNIAVDSQATPNSFVPFVIVKTVEDAINYMENLVKNVE